MNNPLTNTSITFLFVIQFDRNLRNWYKINNILNSKTSKKIYRGADFLLSWTVSFHQIVTRMHRQFMYAKQWKAFSSVIVDSAICGKTQAFLPFQHQDWFEGKHCLAVIRGLYGRRNKTLGAMAHSLFKLRARSFAEMLLQPMIRCKCCNCRRRWHLSSSEPTA